MKKTYINKSRKILNNAIEYLHYLGTLPFDGTLEVVIRKHTKKRSLDQNALYWRLISQIAEQAWANGRQYSCEIWHYYCKQNIMANDIVLKNGNVWSKYITIPRIKNNDDVNRTTIISTADLSKESFSEYIEAVTAFAVTELGVTFEV